MYAKRIVTILVSIALLGLPALVLSAGPAQAATVTRVLIERQPAKQLFKGPVQVAGRLQSDAGGGAWADRSGQTLTLERKLAGGDFATIGSATTNFSGIAIFDTKAKANATYRVRYAGDVTYNPGVSGSVKVKVARDLGAKEKQIGKGKFRFYGKAKPNYGKKQIVLQKRDGGKWRKIGAQKTSKKGNWSFVVFAKRKPGTVQYRTVTKKDKKYIKSYSAVFNITTTFGR